MRGRALTVLLCAVLVITGAAACSSQEPPRVTGDRPTASTTVDVPSSVAPGDLVVASVTWNGQGRVFARGAVQAWAAGDRPVSVTGSGGWHSQVIYGIATGDRAPIEVEVTDGSTVRADVRRWTRRSPRTATWPR